MANTSAAAAGALVPMRADVMIALALQRKSATSVSCLRQSSGSGAAIMPARSTPSSAITLLTVLASWIATTLSVATLRAPAR